MIMAEGMSGGPCGGVEGPKLRFNVVLLDFLFV
jgi:hypothetical protein